MGQAESTISPSGELPSSTALSPDPAGNPQRDVYIRSANPDDVIWILPELRAFAQFYGTKLSLFPKDDAVATAIITNIIRNHLFVVAESLAGEPYGFVAGFSTNHIYNPEIRILAEAFWWVKPEFRTVTRAGTALLDVFIDWGKKNAHWITFTLEHHSPVSASTLKKRGFKLQESNYLMEHS